MKKVLITASVISFIEWFNKENITFLHEELGCEVHVACNTAYMEDTDVERTRAYLGKLADEGIILHHIPFDRSPLTRANRKACKELKALIDGDRFDLIHCHTPAAAMMTRLAARKARKAGTVVMYTCHGFHFHHKSSKINWLIYYPAERFLSRFCDYIITINQEDYHRAQTFHAANVRYIPGVGVDVEKIRHTAVDQIEYKKSIGIPENALMILSLGELIERKNHEVIIKALSKIERNDLYYVICGKGPLAEHLRLTADELKIGDRVILLGFRRDVPELCKTADIGAFPSRIEGLGLAGIEMMAAGIPLVSSDVHGIVDYVRDGVTGYTCPPDDADAFAKAIQKLIDHPETVQKMRAACYEAVQPFDIRSALDTMWKIYREVL